MRKYLCVLFLLVAMVALATATVAAEDWQEYITAEGEDNFIGKINLLDCMYTRACTSYWYCFA